MKKLIIIIGLILLVSCGKNEEVSRDYYIVKRFEVGEELVIRNVSGRKVYLKSMKIYEMDLITERGDIIHERFLTDSPIRFIPGDMIYLWYGNWILKNR